MTRPTEKRAGTTVLARDERNSMQTERTIASARPWQFHSSINLFASAVIVIGFTLTVSWIFLLGYGLFKLIELVI